MLGYRSLTSSHPANIAINLIQIPLAGVLAAAGSRSAPAVAQQR